MKNQHLTSDEIISAVRGMDLKDFQTVRDLDYSIGILEIKIRQMREEIRKRKAEGRD